MLSGVRMTASETGHVTIEATDLESYVCMSRPATVSEPGTAIIPARKLAGLLSSLRGQVKVETTDAVATIRCGRGRYTLPVYGEDYPDAQPFTGGASVYADILREAVAAVSSCCCAPNSGRAILEGVHVRIADGQLTATATDGRRLARWTTAAVGGQQFEAVIPGSMLPLLPKGGAYLIGINAGAVHMHSIEETISCRMVEGQYPNIDQVIPAEFAHDVTVDAPPAIDAVRRVSQLHDSKDDASVSLSVVGGEMRIECAGSVESVDCVGGDCTMQFNPSYIVDALRMVGARARMQIVDSGPVLITGAEERAMAVVMQMRKG